MSRTKPADQRREDLLDAAQASFVERGVAATTIDHITSGAGVAKGTFYLYFRSRDDIVTAVQRRYGQRFVDQLRGAIDRAGDDWAAKLDACVDAALRHHHSERATHDVLFVHVPTTDAVDGDGVDELTAVFGDLLRSGVAAGAYRVDDVDPTAVLLFNTLHGVYNPIWTGSEPFDDDRLIAAARTIFRRAVGLPDAPPKPRRRTQRRTNT